MNSQFIQSISINWDRIGRDSYLRDIEAIRGMEQMVFKSPITFFVGEAGRKTTGFPPMIPIQNSMTRFGFSEGFINPDGDIFSGRRVSTM